MAIDIRCDRGIWTSLIGAKGIYTRPIKNRPLKQVRISCN